MAYNLANRFSRNPSYNTLLDPCAYHFEGKTKYDANKVPFLSKCPRNTQPGAKIWTHAIYNADNPPSIYNCSSLMSKIPRFPYEALSKEDIEKILCQCGVQLPCECPVGEEEPVDVKCQAKIARRLFKGSTLRRDALESEKNRRHKAESPPFYDATVNESTAFYKGCKWSKRSGKPTKTVELSPGPAYYTIEKKLTKPQICAEKVKAQKRKTSKQYRFIEMVQRANILEGRPGPATYSPMTPKCTDLQYLGPKADRFSTSKYDVIPGPTEYWLKRDFDPPETPETPCHAVLPEPSCFGVKAERFKPRVEEGASPASYDINYKPCQILHCQKAPFGTATVRFKPDPIEESDEEIDVDEILQKENDTKAKCPNPTWGFRSQTIRLKALKKNFYEPSPADLPQSHITVQRSPYLQYVAPFYSSEGRFQPWLNWMPVQAKMKTPGPCYYRLEKPKCPTAVPRGPLRRCPRFPSLGTYTPAPNEYNVGGGIETVCDTHNKRLHDNIGNQHIFKWNPPPEPRKLTAEEREIMLLNKCISLLEIKDSSDVKTMQPSDTPSPLNNHKQKLLRHFLYRHKVATCS